jgi:hypothetical protein
MKIGRSARMIANAIRFLIRFIRHTAFTAVESVQYPLIILIGPFLILKIALLIALIQGKDRVAEDAYGRHDEDAQQCVQKKETLI